MPRVVRYGTRVSDERSVVMVVPITPADSGNGLAMRAGMLLDALAQVADVHVVIVPVSGPANACGWAEARACSVSVVDTSAGVAGYAHVTMQLADPDLRERLQRTAPLPARATLAPPTLAQSVAAALGDGVGQPAAVLAMRLYLAPLGVYLARELGAVRVVVDADDDDATLLRALGDHDEAEAFDRLARCWLPAADAVFAASGVDATAIAARAGLDGVGVVPNVVTIPAAPGPRPGTGRLLFVGNLTYEPNRVAARALVREILPAVRRAKPGATLDLVGPHGGALDDLGGVEGVRLTGAVPDVTPWYAGADVVVVPLRHGSGTRIKVLEAFAHARPVVATRVAVAGLDVDLDFDGEGSEDGRTVAIADSTDGLAKAVVRLLDDAPEAMIARAAALVAHCYSPAVVAPLVQSAVLGRAVLGASDGPGPGRSAAA
jgi:glycosyltransferase involved in cell wall biosynthesis